MGFATIANETMHILLYRHRKTQGDLAEHLGKSRTYIQKKMRCDVAWNADEMGIVAEWLDEDPVQFAVGVQYLKVS